ncbi:MAG: F0F1 ATP synthase subunit delta [Patescibacteria group bacterium]
MRDSYLQATLALIQEGYDPQKLIDGLKETLAARGHQALLPSILQAVLRELEAGKTTTKVTVAKATDAEVLKAEITAALKNIQATDEVVTEVDETIVGGFVATGNGKTIDASYKHKLVHLYRSLTT